MPEPLLVLAAAALCGVGAVSLRHPRWTMSGLLVFSLLLDNDFHGGALEQQKLFYAQASGIPLSPPDVLLGAAAAGALLSWHDRPRRLGVPPALALALALLGACALAAVVTGIFGGATRLALVREGRPLVYLVVVPLVIAALFERHHLRLFVWAFVALVVAKAAVGVTTSMLGEGASAAGLGAASYRPTRLAVA